MTTQKEKRIVVKILERRPYMYTPSLRDGTSEERWNDVTVYEQEFLDVDIAKIVTILNTPKEHPTLFAFTDTPKEVDP